MPSKRPQWNISNEEGSKLMLKEINSIVLSAFDMTILMSSVAKLLKENNTHKIKHWGKSVSAYEYISKVFGGLESFVDRFEGITLFIREEIKYIKILDEDTIFSEYPLNSYCGWEIINVPEINAFS